VSGQSQAQIVVVPRFSPFKQLPVMAAALRGAQTTCLALSFPL
jgi:hypothetical protein